MFRIKYMTDHTALLVTWVVITVLLEMVEIYQAVSILVTNQICAQWYNDWGYWLEIEFFIAGYIYIHSWLVINRHIYLTAYVNIIDTDWPVCLVARSESVFNRYPAVHDNPCLCKQCRSRSDGFWRSHLIRIYTVCHSVCEFERKYYMM